MPSLVDALATVRALLSDPEHLVLATAGGRRRGMQNPWRRAEIRYVDLKSGRHLQVTTYDRTQAHTRNADLDSIDRMVMELVDLPWATWHVESLHDGGVMRTSLRVTKKGDPLLHQRIEEREAAPDRSHDQRKTRMIDPADQVLRALGIADPDGRIKPSRQSKYRQVEEFCRLLGPAVDDLLSDRPADRPLRVVDLGCGNAYLTFAAWRYLSGVRGIDLRMVGVDVKAQAYERNSRLAEQLGAADTLTFVEGTIATAELAEPPDVVLALHACDTATDDALARALQWEAGLVLAAPCCHHYLQRRLKAVEPPGPYGLLTRHGILRERLADTLTDAMRAALMRMQGYRVQVVEFVDSAHTPRNTLLRAVRTGGPSGDVEQEYTALVEEWGVEPRLADLIGTR